MSTLDRLNKALRDAVADAKATPAPLPWGQRAPCKGLLSRGFQVIHVPVDSPASLAEQLSTLHDPEFCWLEDMDMGMLLLSPDTNLLVSILMRVYEAIPSRASDPASVDVFRVATDATRFPGNLGERASQLDPEQYAAEMMSEERSRIGFVPRVRAALAADTSKIFILPVHNMLDVLDDDGPMVEQLCKVVDFIGSPHLVVLLLGEIPSNLPDYLISTTLVECG